MRTILFLLIAVILSACNAEKTDNQFKTIEYKTSKTNESPKITFDFKASLQVPDNMEGNIKKPLRDNIISASLGSPYADQNNSKVLKSYADVSFSEYVDMFADLNLDFGDDTEIEAISCMTDITGEVVFISPDILSYKTSIYTFSGGAHGMTSVSNYVFDMHTGNILKEEDIFIPGYQRVVHNLLVQNAEPLRNDSILPVEADAYFNDSLIQPNGNVAVNDNGIVYTFNPYEIAPYCFGYVDVEIPKEQIIPFLNKGTAVYSHLTK